MTKEHNPDADAVADSPAKAPVVQITLEPPPPSLMKALTTYIRATGLKGKARDDAADNFMAGAVAGVLVAKAGIDPDDLTVPEEGGYLAVLEALAD